MNHEFYTGELENLVIELQERVDKLESRIEELENGNL